jgi:hypothetical protein
MHNKKGLSMNKHAFLIMAHNEFGVLKSQIRLLDDPRNDIYIHVDKKSTVFKPGQFINLTQYSKLIFIERKRIAWGGYSQIDCELRLLKAALKNGYEYYHKISGVDLPIKRMDDIHHFFDRYKGAEFMLFQHDALSNERFINRVRYYHLLQELIGHQKNQTPLHFLNRALIRAQIILGVNRMQKHELVYQKGEAFFSITHDLALFIVSKEKEIRKIFKLTQCGDEFFIHTIAWNSHFRDRLLDQALWYTDWKRGQPYVFRAEDFETLIGSEGLWARKFSAQVSSDIVEKIYKYVKFIK